MFLGAGHLSSIPTASTGYVTYAKPFVKSSVSVGKIMMADNEDLPATCLFKPVGNKGCYKMEIVLRSHKFQRLFRRLLRCMPQECLRDVKNIRNL